MSYQRIGTTVAVGGKDFWVPNVAVEYDEGGLRKIVIESEGYVVLSKKDHDELLAKQNEKRDAFIEALYRFLQVAK